MCRYGYDISDKVNAFFEKYGQHLSSEERDVLRLRLGLDDGYQLTNEEISEWMEVETKRIEEIYNNAINKVEASVFGYHKLLYCIFAAGIPHYYEFDYVKLIELLNEALGTLSETEQKIIQLRAGLFDCKERTQKECGIAIGRSATRAAQIEWCALRKLRHPDISKPLWKYISTLQNQLNEG